MLAEGITVGELASPFLTTAVILLGVSAPVFASWTGPVFRTTRVTLGDMLDNILSTVGRTEVSMEGTFPAGLDGPGFELVSEKTFVIRGLPEFLLDLKSIGRVTGFGTCAFCCVFCVWGGWKGEELGL